MEAQLLLAQVGTLAAATLSPGPNNVAVADTVARAGQAAALRVMAGVVLGGLLLIAVAATLGCAVLEPRPRLRLAVAWIGAIWLCALGLHMMLAGPEPGSSHPQQSAAAANQWTFCRLLTLQFINPKAWTLALAIVAATPADAPGALITLAALFVVVSILSLWLWSVLGSFVARHVHTPSGRRRLDQVFGALLAVSALSMVWPQ